MTQDEVKEKLVSLGKFEHDFSVIFSGKKSKTRNGQYHPAERLIVINNRNFQDDNLLMYTAIHELAHHIVLVEKGVNQSHSILFWSVFHELLAIAEEKKIYTRERPEKVKALVAEIKEVNVEIARLNTRLGELLNTLRETCEEEAVRFDDVIDRELTVKRTTAKRAMKIAAIGIPEEVGADAQAVIAAMPSTGQQEQALNAIREGRSIDQVRQSMKRPRIDDIERERIRIERTIAMLTRRLDEISRELKSA